MNPTTTSKFAALMGSASLITLINALPAQAQQVAQAQMAQAQPDQVPEQVLITGSLIHGAAAVGVPVTNLGTQDFTETGNATIGDLFRTIPQANVAPGPSAVNSGGHQERETRVNIRGLDQTGPRTLLMIDGVRFPPQADGICAVDPSIIPALALDRVDILADGASATYGSDAIAGVINVVLKRSYDGAVTLFHVQAPDHGGVQYQASQLYGRTWDGGDITLTYEWMDENHVPGNVHSKYTMDYTPWGLDNPIPLAASIPGTISTGAPSSSNISCNNCWAIPHGAGSNFPGGLGPTAPSSAVGLINWTTFSGNAANKGTGNVIDPLKEAWEQAAVQKNSFVATFDQRLAPGISFFASGFYSNRRIEEIAPAVQGQNITNLIKTFSVPTINPYYPTNAPSNLRVSYDFARELPPTIPAFELSYRYQFGLNLDLPFEWSGQIFDSRSYESNVYTINTINDNAVNVALGSTVGGVSKPAGVPYINLFCDVTQFNCNSPATLAYIKAQRYLGDKYSIEEKGARFDGPLFDLPAGSVKAAIGGTYESDNVLGFTGNNSGSPAGTPLSIINDAEPYAVWAGYAQVQVPVFGDNFNIPLVRKLDLEFSWRHDQYSGTLSGGTSNPKVAFTWVIDDQIGATVRGSWGSSFRFANAGEYSTVLSDANDSFNLPNQGALHVTCSGAAPIAGSAGAALFAAGFGCNSTPGGFSWGGGPHPELRSYTDAATGQVASREGGLSLPPEKSINYSVGFELAPQSFLRGLDAQVTWYSVKVNGTLLGFNTTTDNTIADPLQRFHIILPSDLGCPVAANANPTSCAPFEKMALAGLLDRNNAVGPSALTSIYWISDASTASTGFLKVQGLDWNVSYNTDLGDLGAWNIGMTGTYYLHRYNATINGGTVVDLFHQNIQGAGGIPQNGVETLPRFIYRARLGWSDGPWSVTGFMNYISHYYAPWPVPPNVNLQCTSAGGTTGGGSFPCAISNWSNIEPSWYTFDLSIGYNTGDMPANNYLKNVTLQLTIQNLMNIHSAFEYGPSTSTRSISGYDILKPDTGRMIGLTVIKNW
jgi:iron complex outermembrane receptor protein